MSRILYYGIFFDDISKKIISNDFHVTFRYLPNKDERINDVVGRKYTLKIVGIENNGKNSGVLIEIPDEIKKYYLHRYEKDGKEIPIIPHMTLSIAENSKNRYTRDLDFKTLDEPIEITGRFGYLIEEVPEDKTSRYITFEKVS